MAGAAVLAVAGTTYAVHHDSESKDTPTKVVKSVTSESSSSSAATDMTKTTLNGHTYAIGEQVTAKIDGKSRDLTVKSVTKTSATLEGDDGSLYEIGH